MEENFKKINVLREAVVVQQEVKQEVVIQDEVIEELKQGEEVVANQVIEELKQDVVAQPLLLFLQFKGKK